jgi:Ser-tRNA(Ala) deacylase AlaX
MQEALYLDDSYLKTCISKVIGVENNEIYLDRTVFYPKGGGLPSDNGKIKRIADGKEFTVTSVSKKERKILHQVLEEGLKIGDEVECQINWERRYKLMRMHTAGHVLAALMYSKLGVLITGNQIDVDKSRFDFSMENFSKEKFEEIVKQANEVLVQNLEVTISYLPREEALKIEGAVKLANVLPPEIKTLRMVKIGDVDYQADGGPHVKNTSEIGKIVLIAAENKGKNNKRIIFTVEDP